jgi:hypothetical protein
LITVETRHPLDYKGILPDGVHGLWTYTAIETFNYHLAAYDGTVHIEPYQEVPMTLQGPTPEDIRKIHAEVNQHVNQRFIVTTLAVSVFGVVVAWLLPKTPPTPGSSVGAFMIGGAILLLLLLFLLYWLSHLLRGMLRIHTTYLIVNNASGWEKDWAEYRKEKYWAHTKPQTVVFMVLGLFATAFPFVLAAIFRLSLEPPAGLIALAILGLLYEVFVWLMGFHDLWSAEIKAQSRWEGLNK